MSKFRIAASEELFTAQKTATAFRPFAFMKISHISVAVCGNSANDTLLGKRGDRYKLLGGVALQSKWKECFLAIPAFVSADTSLEAAVTK